MQYPVDATLTVYVNPANPQQSVVVHRSLWSGFAMLFPMVFVLIGAGVIGQGRREDDVLGGHDPRAGVEAVGEPRLGGRARRV